MFGDQVQAVHDLDETGNNNYASSFFMPQMNGFNGNC